MPAARRAPRCQFDEHEPARTVAVSPPVRALGGLIPAENYREYERRKQAWIDAQIAAGRAPTSFEYDKAVLRIAQECGV